jgi:hypothetical protein
LPTGSDGRPRHRAQRLGQDEQDEQDDGRKPSGYPVNPVHPVKKMLSTPPNLQMKSSIHFPYAI